MVVFPQNPALGQIWVAENTATYTWLGDRWNSATAVLNGRAEFYEQGGRANTWATPTNGPQDKELNGGTATTVF
jgi:hypothetical protein